MRYCGISPRSLALHAMTALLVAACARTPVIDKETEQAQNQPALPAYPKSADLVSVDIGGNFDYFIDPDSIRIVGGVVQYTVVARSRAGATNISFEGLRCRTLEHKLYAFGRPDATWSPSRNADWDNPRNSSGTYYSVLADYFFCPDARPVQNVAEAVRALKLGRHPATVPRTY